MICGVGADIVDIARFEGWTKYPQEQLLKIFSPQELADCSLVPEKLAARFAAKEAFFKALSATLEHKSLTQQEFTLSFICRTVSVTQSNWGTPQLAVDWQSIHGKIGHTLPHFTTQLSLSHDGSMAVAFVIIEE